jgi:PAS domain-containing protein
MSGIENHEDLIRGISEQQRSILDSSRQAVYIYLDDNHFVFNQKFASLLGYDSAKELQDFKGSLLPALVSGKSQKLLVDAFQKAMNNMEASSVEIFWKKKMGGEVKTTVILTPLIYDGKLFAIHYIF